MGVVSLSVRLPQVSKARPVPTAPVDVGGGTNGTHYRAFLMQLMDEMDKNGMEGFNIVMDNAPIHRMPIISEMIRERGYNPVYLPRYSPFLNPIEEFWSKLKANFNRRPLGNGEGVVSR
ncbi:hypothetical protein BGZ58_005079, partial [Dissophora ornata]